MGIEPTSDCCDLASGLSTVDRLDHTRPFSNIFQLRLCSIRSKCRQLSALGLTR